MMFFPLHFRETGQNLNLLQIFSEINLSPFYFYSFSSRPFALHWIVVDFGLNLLLTLPFGFGVAYFCKPGILKILLWAVATGLSLEGSQLLMRFFFENPHVVDINDVILNSIGVLLGWGLFSLMHWAARWLNKKRGEV